MASSSEYRLFVKEKEREKKKKETREDGILFRKQSFDTPSGEWKKACPTTRYHPGFWNPSAGMTSEIPLAFTDWPPSDIPEVIERKSDSELSDTYLLRKKDISGTWWL